MRIFVRRGLWTRERTSERARVVLPPPLVLSLAEAYHEDTVFAGTGTDEVFSCRFRLMDGGVYVAPVNLPFHKDP